MSDTKVAKEMDTARMPPWIRKLISYATSRHRDSIRVFQDVTDIMMRIAYPVRTLR
jgi:hypothetical protein